jgi:hypothetical protein
MAGSLEIGGHADIVRVPDIDIDLDGGAVSICGESYPEEGRQYFDDAFEAFFAHYQGRTGTSLKVLFSLTYYNSGSAHFFMHLITFLDALAAAGNDVEITWRFFEDDDSMRDRGEDFSAEMKHARFVLEELSDDHEDEE